MNEIILATDVHYTTATARAAGILFSGWNAQLTDREVVVDIDNPQQYQPGEFFRRELPCLQALLQRFDVSPDLIVIDGYVWLDDAARPGLGAHLYEFLDQRVPVIGIAKTHFRGAPAIKVFRGESLDPLYVSAAGIDERTVAEHVRTMFGPYRIPFLLKRVDQLSRGIPS